MQPPDKTDGELIVEETCAIELNRFFEFIATVVSSLNNNTPAARSLATQATGVDEENPSREELCAIL